MPGLTGASLVRVMILGRRPRLARHASRRTRRRGVFAERLLPGTQDDRTGSEMSSPRAGVIGRRECARPAPRAARVGLVTHSEQEENDDQTQRDTEEPEQNQHHRVFSLCGPSLAGPVTREGHFPGLPHAALPLANGARRMPFGNVNTATWPHARW
jgi:hypothetical protein